MPATPKVLIVDDDADLRRLSQLSLSKVAHWEVVVGSTGRDAVALAALHLPDVVLLDVSMPEMDGPTALRAIRADPRTAHIPAIFITARALPSEIEMLVAMGAAGVITKPFDAVRLPAQILELMGPKGAAFEVPKSKPPEPARASLPDGPAGLEAALAAQRAQYLEALPRRIEALGSAIDRAREQASLPLLEAARVLSHKLRGSAGSYGLESVAQAAASIEEAIREADGDVSHDALWPRVTEGLALLRRAVA